MTRILITGSRRWSAADVMADALANAIARFDGPVTIVHGAAAGADRLVDALAPTLGARVSVERWPADWTGPCRPGCRPGHRQIRTSGSPYGGGASYCPAAGTYRNAEMVAAGADLCLAFPIGESRGTRDCMRRAEAAGIEVVNVGDQIITGCPHKHYRTERYATRQAHSLESDRSRRPTPVPCECGTGAWRLASRDAAPDPTTTPTDGAA